MHTTAGNTGYPAKKPSKSSRRARSEEHEAATETTGEEANEEVQQPRGKEMKKIVRRLKSQWKDLTADEELKMFNRLDERTQKAYRRLLGREQMLANKKRKKEGTKKKTKKQGAKKKTEKEGAKLQERGKENKAQEKLRDDQHRADRLKPNALIALLGPGNLGEDTVFTADQVVQGIQTRVTNHPGMLLEGRGLNSLRINYAPAARDITSIHARVHKAQAVDLGNKDIDKMLQPLIAWNRSAFMDIPEHIFRDYAAKCTKGRRSNYESQWEFQRGCYKKIRPITWEKREQIVASIYYRLRQQHARVKPSSKLLYASSNKAHDGKARNKWGLTDVKEGFGKKLMECFEDPTASSEEYQDLLEACLYAFEASNNCPGAHGNQNGGRGPRHQRGEKKKSSSH